MAPNYTKIRQWRAEVHALAMSLRDASKAPQGTDTLAGNGETGEQDEATPVASGTGDSARD